MKSLKGILIVGEKNIFNELSQIITIATQANAELKIMFENAMDIQILTKNLQSVRALEKKSDEIAFALSEDITSGAVSPNIIDNLIESAHLADNIVDIIFYLSRELSRMARANPGNPSLSRETEQWAEIYGHMLILGDQTLAKLKQMLSTSSVPEVLQLRKEIETLEEQGDEIKDVAFDKLYMMSFDLHFLRFYHYSEMLHKSDDILDTCEDLSDVLVSIVTSILK